MSKAFYHEGLTIEPDVVLQELRIEGRKLNVAKEGELFVYKEHPEISAQKLDQLGKKIIDSWRQIKDNREDIKEEHLQILKVGVRHWNQWRRDNPQIRPILYKAILTGEDLSSEEPVDFSNTNLIEANLSHANLNGVNFHEANLGRADLSHAKLIGAHFCRTDLYETNLSHAILHRANLQGTQMAMTDLTGAELKECKIYGLSAWDLKMDGAVQEDLKIIYTKQNVNREWEESQIVVDDLRVAQFIYLLLHNENIRYVIDTITSKAVLILGRFYNERKIVLDALRDALREKGKLVPIIFDFEQPKNRDLTETVRLLADMAKFVIADLTDAKSIPQELDEIIPFLPSVPIIPILKKNGDEFSMFEHWKKYPWVRPVFLYKDKDHLITNIEKEILKTVEDWEDRKDKIIEQKKKIEELKKTDPDLYKQLKDNGIIVD